MNPLWRLKELGQSLWLDSISRKLLDEGELARLVREDGIVGVTSNPSIFEKAIGSGDPAYTREIARVRALRPQAAVDASEIYEGLAIRDIRDAADLLRPIHASTQKRDGYVSLEVTLRDGSEASDILGEARHLWSTVDRPNVMIKVPGTPAGIEAFETLIGEGTNVNVTLLFARDAYEAVAAGYLRGIEAFVARGGDPARVESVASFFVSRIDTAVDKELEGLIASAPDARTKERARALLGKIAIANAKLAYEHYQEVFSGPRWEKLAARGARTQRVLWASTGTKNKRYSDVLYMEELIGRDTVDTAPIETIDAFRDHGRPRASLTEDVEKAHDDLRALAVLGIDLERVTDTLLEEGLKSFDDAFAKLLRAIDGGAPSASTSAAPASMTWKLSKNLETPLALALEEWRKPGGKAERLARRDASLWTGGEEARWLGWLDAPEKGRASAQSLVDFAAEIRAEGFTHVLLLGMGGSSLAPEVFARTFGSAPGHPALVVLDSTDPDEVAAAEARVDLARTLVIVASKSGSTLEPALFEAFFFERIASKVGAAHAGRQFVAITDPGSKLEATARKKGYRRIFAGEPDIGGRFSALSNFGLVPAAAIGVDLGRILDGALAVARACSAKGTNAGRAEDGGVALGLIVGLAAESGRDKLTLVLSPKIAGLGAWLEQLVAESTGKQKKGIVPIDGEPLGAPDVYGHDRLFVYVRDRSAPDRAQDAGVDALEQAGHPVVRIAVLDAHDLGAQFFRWEVAVAVAGSVLGIDPFDQPDVEASKIATRTLTSEVEKTGALPPEEPFLVAGAVELHADPQNKAALLAQAGREPTLVEVLAAHLGRARAGDYFALLAYLERNAENERELSELRLEVRDALRVATCLGFGPRFLHSTGQLYKGGPNSGVFLQITQAHERDLRVPGQTLTFGLVEAAQARGDLQVLVERGRRALHVHVRAGGLAELRRALSQALAQHAEFTT